jgi:hypothetical protein
MHHVVGLPTVDLACTAFRPHTEIAGMWSSLLRIRFRARLGGPHMNSRELSPEITKTSSLNRPWLELHPIRRP